MTAPFLGESAALLPLQEELRASCWWQDESRKREIDASLQAPQTMKLWVFQAVQARLMDMRVLAARGHDATAGFGQRLQLLEHLVQAAPWSLDSDLGLIPKNEAAGIELRAERTAR